MDESGSTMTNRPVQGRLGSLEGRIGVQVPTRSGATGRPGYPIAQRCKGLALGLVWRLHPASVCGTRPALPAFSRRRGTRWLGRTALPREAAIRRYRHPTRAPAATYGLARAAKCGDPTPSMPPRAATLLADGIDVEGAQEALDESGARTTEHYRHDPTRRHLSARHEDPSDRHIDVGITSTRTGPVDDGRTSRTHHHVEWMQIQMEETYSTSNGRVGQPSGAASSWRP